jgi:hypothetical protein
MRVTGKLIKFKEKDFLYYVTRLLFPQWIFTILLELTGEVNGFDSIQGEFAGF